MEIVQIALPDQVVPSRLALRHNNLETFALGALAVAVLAFFLADLHTLPMQLWDESRLSVNAAEAALTGHYLVTTYGFAPDLWNTKPPLAINLMAASIELFGFNTFALRLPSALAAIGTLFAVTAFVRSLTLSLGWGLVAGLVLGSSLGFYGFHAGQTADYDALLTLLTTAYGVLLFVLLDSHRRRPWLAVSIGCLVGMAVLTKGIAGVIPGCGAALYAVLFARHRLVEGWREFAGLGAVALLIGGGFYLIRSYGDPAYAAAVWANELGGRYAAVLDHHQGPRLFYLRQLLGNVRGDWLPLFAVPGAGIVGLAAPWLTAGRQRRAAAFALCQVVALILIYSSAATKIAWYMEPVLPFLAVLLTLVMAGATARFARQKGRWPAIGQGFVAIALVAIVGQAVYRRSVEPLQPEARPRAFDQLFAAADAAQAWPLTVVDRGYQNDAGFKNYAPTLRLYILSAEHDRHRAQQSSTDVAATPARFVGSCDPSTLAAVAALGPMRWARSGCVLVGR